jgi:FAD/FMN-containing dehydrogenase
MMLTDVITELQRVLDSSGVLLGDDVASRQATWSGGTCKALAIVRPRNTEEVAAVMRVCHAANQPVVPQGGKTSVVGGSLSDKNEIVVSLERMVGIEELDEANRTMIVQAGIPLQAVQESAEAVGLMFAVDFTVRGTATIGGIIATNAGGNRVIRYGMAREQVLGIEAVLADGTVVTSLGKAIKNNAGYDIKQLFIGTEGTLGIITRAVLRLRPLMHSQNTALVAATDFTNLISLLKSFDRSLGGNLSAFEVMWNNFYRVVSPAPGKSNPPLGWEYPYYVLIEATGAEQEMDAARFERVLAESFNQGLIADAVLAKSRAERDELWAIRENVEVLPSLEPLFAFDVSLAIGDMEDYIKELCQKLSSRWPDFRYFVMGHLGDGNIHIFISIGSDDPAERCAIEEIVYSSLASRGGSISAEHGIGLQKRDYLHCCRSKSEIELMHALKQTLDPKWILNPGKVLAQ